MILIFTLLLFAMVITIMKIVVDSWSATVTVDTSVPQQTGYVLIAISSVDGQIYTKDPNLVHNFQQLTFFDTLKCVDAYQLRDGYLYTLLEDGHVYKVTNDIDKPVTELVQTSSVLSIDNNDVDITDGSRTIGKKSALKLITFLQFPESATFLGVDNIGNMYSSTDGKIVIKEYTVPQHCGSLNYDTVHLHGVRVKTLNVQYYNDGNSNCEHAVINVSSTSKIEQREGISTRNNIPKFRRIKFMSDRTAVAIGFDNYMYYIKDPTLVRYPRLVLNNTCMISEICILPDDTILGVDMFSKKIRRRINGIDGTWSTELSDTCCIQSLCVFFV